jgi:hypothetical protein
MPDLSIRDARKYLCWCFGFESLLILLFPFRHIALANHRSDALLAPPGLLNAAFFSLAAAILGAAWWAVWQRKLSARGWGIAASLTCVLIFLHPDTFHRRSIWGHVGALVIGTIGLVAFLRQDDQNDSGKNPNEFANSGAGNSR